MRKPPAIETTATGTLTILSVSPYQEDHSFLEGIIGTFDRKLLKATNVCTARAELLKNKEISVILCECDLMPGSWTDILKHIRPMPQPPSLVVTSRLADERLWSEVLDLGGWDLLAKPFRKSEVIRSVKAAWEHWRFQSEYAVGSMKVMQAD